MIRLASINDMPDILRMGQSFFSKTEYSKDAKFSADAATRTAEHLINSDDGVLVVYDDGEVKGMAAALLYPFYMSGELTGQELFWWCEEKGKGGLLLDALESEAKEKGAKTFTMVSLENLNPKILDKIYLKKGYNRSEHTYLKVF